MKLYGRNKKSLDKLMKFAKETTVSPETFGPFTTMFLETIINKGVTHIQIGDTIYKVKAKKAEKNEGEIF